MVLSRLVPTLVVAGLLGSQSAASAGPPTFGPDSLIIYGLFDGIGPWGRRPPASYARPDEVYAPRRPAMVVRRADSWVVWVRGRRHAGHWTRYPGTSHTSWHRPPAGTHPAGTYIHGLGAAYHGLRASHPRMTRSLFFPSRTSDGGHLYVRHRAASVPLLIRYGGADLEARYGSVFEERLERSTLMFEATAGGYPARTGLPR